MITLAVLPEYFDRVISGRRAMKIKGAALPLKVGDKVQVVTKDPDRPKGPMKAAPAIVTDLYINPPVMTAPGWPGSTIIRLEGVTE